MKRIATIACMILLSTAALAATKTAPAPKAPAPLNPADQTSALFFTTCAESMGSEKDFTKKMQALADVKTAVKMSPDNLKDMVSPEESKNAWAVKGFADPNKPLLIAYNGAQNTCGMHVSDVDADNMRHAFQADLKKFADQLQAKVKIYKPQKKDDLTAYSLDLLTKENKILQLGIAVSPSAGKEYLTIHL